MKRYSSTSAVKMKNKVSFNNVDREEKNKKTDQEKKHGSLCSGRL